MITVDNWFVSIIVPTYKDWARLARCVAALTEQTYEETRFEVIIVNNDPHDEMPLGFLLPVNFKLVKEAKPGSYAARNAALRIAKGNVIGFTDSDCIPDKSWIENAVTYLQKHNDCSRVAGPVLVFPNNTAPTISEQYDMIYAFPQQVYVTKGKSSVTANLFTYKAVFEAIGYFNDSLLSNSDLEWGRLAQRANFSVHFVENVLVRHPARNLNALIQKARRIGGGRGMVERTWNNKLSNMWALLNGFRPRLGEIKYINSHEKQLGKLDKIKVLLLRHYLLQLSAYERLRVQLGKRPRRA